MCVDYKIIEKVLSLRLTEALPHIIHPDQTYGIKDHAIFNNLYIIRDIINYANERDIPTYIIALDYEKAFDKVDHSFLQKTLSAFGFGSCFINFIIASNSSSFARVSNNGHQTRNIPIERSIKQGGPLSQQLFDLIAEVLAVAIRKHPHIKGFRIPGSTSDTKTSLYADDNTPIVTTQQSIHHLFDLLTTFEKASGCNINHSKTAGLTIGHAQLPSTDFQISWNPPQGLKSGSSLPC